MIAFAIPTASLSRITQVRMSCYAGSALQVIPDTGRRDHIAMNMVLDTKLHSYVPRHKPDSALKKRWSQDAMAEGAKRGLHIKTFVIKVETCLAHSKRKPNN